MHLLFIKKFYFAIVKMYISCCSNQLFLQILGVIAVSASVIPWILIPVFPLLLLFIYLRRYFLQTSRDVKRLESTSEYRQVRHQVLYISDTQAWYSCTLLILQLEVRSSPTCPRLFKACGPSERFRQRKGSRKPLMTIKTCTHVRKFRFCPIA